MAAKLMIVHKPMPPSWLQPILEIAVPELRELVEMRFQTDRPYSVDAGKFRARFGQEATSFEDGLDATVRFYRDAARGPAGRISR
jgi:dTDP-D-glucose 4,6-dehydratase